MSSENSKAKPVTTKKFAGILKRPATTPALAPCRIQIQYTDVNPSDSVLDHNNVRFECVPWNAPVIHAYYLTPPMAAKRVLQLTLDISSSGITYSPGDYLCVICPNSAPHVNALLARLGLQGECDKLFTLERVGDASQGFPTHIRSPTTVRYALSHYCDISIAPSKSLLKLLAEYSTGTDKEQLLHLTSTAGRETYIKFLNTRATLLDILTLFPTCQPPIAHLLDLLPPLTPRDYSIASFQPMHPTEVSLVFTVVDFTTESPGDTEAKKHVQGICTNWMEQLVTKKIVSTHEDTLLDAVAEKISTLSIDNHNEVLLPLFHKASNFRLPEDSSAPLVLVGPGSGIAPFLGFLEQKMFEVNNQNLKIGQIYVFFGCRTANDYISTRNWLSKLEDSGIITKFVCAFSRDSEDVVYVQHKMLEHTEAIADIMLNQNGHLYICGDGKEMVQGVRDAMIEIIKRTTTTEKNASEIIASWSKEKRFLLDVWC